MVDVMTQNMESRKHMAHIMMNQVMVAVWDLSHKRLLPVSIAALAGKKKKSA